MPTVIGILQRCSYRSAKGEFASTSAAIPNKSRTDPPTVSVRKKRWNMVGWNFFKRTATELKR